MRTLILCLIIGLLSACCPCKHLTTSTGTRDSLHVEIRHRTIWIPDTVDSSHLETSAAVSDARINPDGSLSHSLENKTDDREIPTQRPIEYRDSIVYRDREVEVEKIVEVERKLTWWQQTQIRGFWVTIIIILVLLRKKIFPLIRRFI